MGIATSAKIDADAQRTNESDDAKSEGLSQHVRRAGSSPLAERRFASFWGGIDSLGDKKEDDVGWKWNLRVRGRMRISRSRNVATHQRPEPIQVSNDGDERRRCFYLSNSNAKSLARVAGWKPLTKRMRGIVDGDGDG